MAETSAIAWTKSTFNPWIGCTRVSPGCDHCYAAVSTPARALKVAWGAGQPRRRTSAANWRKPLGWNDRAKTSGEFWPVFVASLADVYDNEVPIEWRTDLFFLIESTPALTWLVLTKRIGNVRGMTPYRWCTGWPKNLWLGATIVDQAEADRDIPKLLQVPAAKRFVSHEPALGPMDWSPWLFPFEVCRDCPCPDPDVSREGYEQCCKEPELLPSLLDWIIVGGESDQPGAKARPCDIEWIRSTVQQCRAAGVACFVKQLGSHLIGEGGFRYAREDRAGADPADWPEDLEVRELPR